MLLTTFLRVHSDLKEVFYHPRQNKYPNLKIICYIKPNFSCKLSSYRSYSLQNLSYLSQRLQQNNKIKSFHLRRNQTLRLHNSIKTSVQNFLWHILDFRNILLHWFDVKIGGRQKNNNLRFLKMTDPSRVALLKKSQYSELFWSAFFRHSSAFGLNMEIYGVSLRIRSECRKMQEKCGPG